jgi:dihydropteroate synthase
LQTSRRSVDLVRPLVMAILNTTPDSFSDGGAIVSVDDALRRAEVCIAEAADILDIGGESTRPGSVRVTVEDEIGRIVPVIEAIAKRFDVAISVDTSKAEVARRAVDAGAEIINDISAMRFDERIGDVAAETKSGLVLMHSRGDFESMHAQAPVPEIMDEVARGFRTALELARAKGVADDAIVLDVGIGFGKTADQNLELIAKLDKLVVEFPQYPILVGTSRKSFIGRILNDAPVDERLPGSLATAAVAIWNGARLVRVHDVKETVEMVKVVEAIKKQL